MKTLFCIDLDGTVAHAGRRFAEAGPEPSRNDKAVYDVWVKNVQNERSLSEDEVVPGMEALVRALISNRENEVVYLTSREEKWRSITEKWLFFNCLPKLPLVMRSNGDYIEGSSFKEGSISFLKALYGCQQVVVIDDDEHHALEKKCLKNGWTMLKARSGGQL